MVTPVVGVPCPHCNVGSEDPCVTSGGWVYEEGLHQKRRKAATQLGAKLRPLSQLPEGASRHPATVLYEKRANAYKADPAPADAANKVKLALWYIGKAGSIDEARKLLNIAAEALNQVPEEKAPDAP